MSVDREKILKTAQKLVDKKRYDKAIVEYRKLVAQDPGDVRTLLKIGDLHLKLDQYEEAITTYEQVGEYYYREGFSVKAIAVYKQIRGIIRRHAAHLEGRYGHIVPRLAEIYTQLGLTSDALAAYDEVATRLRQEGRERDALDIFKKVVDLDPQNPIAHLRVADSRARLGEIDNAVEGFGEAARIMLKLGRHDDSLKVLERLLEYRQDSEYARMAGEILLDRAGPNDGMTALSKLQIAFKANPKDLVTLEVLARAFDAINQPRKAVEVLKESARIANDTGDSASFARLTDVLAERAPEDTAVNQLLAIRDAQDRASQPHAARAAAVAQAALEESMESMESIDEVFELTDDDLHTLNEDGVQHFTEQHGNSTVRRLIEEAEGHRAAGHTHHAIQMIRDGIQTLGGEIGSTTQLRHKLSDLLLEAGDHHGAINEKLTLAHELAQGGAVDPAVQVLDEVLLLHPGHPNAVHMRASLGYGAANAPLDSYDVESGGVDEVLHRTGPGHTSVPPEPYPSNPQQGQAPHAHAPQQAPHSMPAATMRTAGGVPPLGIDEPFGADPSIEPAPASFHDAPPLAERVSFPPMSVPGSIPLPTPSQRQIDEDALDQADILAQEGRYDEARTLLHTQLRNFPNHPLVLDRLAEVDQLAANAPPSTAAPAGGYPAPPTGGYAAPPTGGYAAPPTGGYAAPPTGGYAAPPTGGYPAAPTGGYPAAPTGGYPQVGGQRKVAAHLHHEEPRPAAGAPAQHALDPELEGVMVKVRAGVKHQIDDGDAATHYDLGVAYNEMGLYADAISELTLAARDPYRECVCLSMIGDVHMQLGDIDSALDALHRALNCEHKTRDQELKLGYEIAHTYELKSMPEQAVHYFDWLLKLDPNYADPRGSLAERVHRLRTESGPQRRPESPPDSIAILDQAIDDISGNNG